MTNLFELNKEHLVEDPGLIILQQSVLLCERNNVEEIRYSDLRRESDDKLNELTNGSRPTLGGSFELHVKKFSDTSLLPDKRPFNRVKKGPKKTIIIPNIPVIKNLLTSKELIRSIASMKLVEQEVDHQLLEHACKSLIEEEYATKKKRSKHRLTKTSDFTRYLQDSFMERTSIDLYADLESSLWRLHIAHQGSNPIYLQQEIIQSSLFLGEEIVAAVTDRTMPLKIVLEFNALPKDENMQKSGYYVSRLKSTAPKFADWAARFYNHKVTDEELINISQGQFKVLRRETLKLYKKFWNIVFDYWDIIRYEH
jgi:hypothetical protein